MKMKLKNSLSNLNPLLLAKIAIVGNTLDYVVTRVGVYFHPLGWEIELNEWIAFNEVNGFGYEMAISKILVFGSLIWLLGVVSSIVPKNKRIVINSLLIFYAITLPLVVVWNIAWLLYSI